MFAVTLLFGVSCVGFTGCWLLTICSFSCYFECWLLFGLFVLVFSDAVCFRFTITLGCFELFLVVLLLLWLTFAFDCFVAYLFCYLDDLCFYCFYICLWLIGYAIRCLLVVLCLVWHWGEVVLFILIAGYWLFPWFCLSVPVVSFILTVWLFV